MRVRVEPRSRDCDHMIAKKPENGAFTLSAMLPTLSVVLYTGIQGERINFLLKYWKHGGSET